MFQSGFLTRIVCSFSMVFLLFFHGFGQEPVFTKQDTLRGSITAERSWWDLKYYALFVDVNPQDSTISGSNKIVYKVLKENKVMQIDLQAPMKIKYITQDGKELKFISNGNAHFVQLKKKQKSNEVNELTVYFEGKPHVSTDPPWSGGFTWRKDANGKDFIATSCQGIGASLWWPCKDHPYDEPDSMRIGIAIPTNLGLTAVSNGRLESVSALPGKSVFNWKVTNPINNYAVNVNIGDYVNFTETYNGEKGKLDCSYYVLKDHLKQAQGQFTQVPKMLEAFEHWFGPYPFYEDSYKLVEVPYLGMEHQSSVTYGNGFKNGYLQKDLSGSGWGLNFDFIIIHESGHEWFANNITGKDVADMWIHESFTSYAENLFLDYHYGKTASAEYVIGTRKKIKNDRPIIGIYNVNYEGSGDMYYKGANVLHTLRQLIDDDEKWRNILRKMNKQFYHQVVTTAQIEEFLIAETGIKLQPFFDQYLRDKRVPVLEYKIEHGELFVRWADCVSGFNMKLKVKLNGKDAILYPVSEWQPYTTEKIISEIVVDPNFYVLTKKINN